MRFILDTYKDTNLLTGISQRYPGILDQQTDEIYDLTSTNDVNKLLELINLLASTNAYL